MSMSKMTELAVGLFIALGLAAFFVLAMKVSNISSLGDADGYRISATFDNIGGLKVRSPVSLAGVRVGRVTGIDIDPLTFEAVVEMAIAPKYNQLPKDTSASIYTAGLLGEQYISLEPGGAEEVLQQGDRIKLTQSAIVLERLIGQVLYERTAGDSGE